MNRATHLPPKKGHSCLLALLFLITSFTASAQYLRKDWDYDYGGVKWEECNSVIETSSGNFVMAGYTASDSSFDVTSSTYDLFPSPDKGDFWVLVTDQNGLQIDNRRFGGDRQDRLWSIEETQDGGFIMGGSSRSNVGNDKTEPCFGFMDYWLLKVDQNLEYEWDRTFGGDQRDFLYELIQTSDGGYLAVGTSESGISGTKSEIHRGQFDLWIVKTDADGNLKWEKTIGGVEEERVNVVLEQADGNYVIGGACESPVDGVDILEPGFGGKDYWVIKIDSLNGDKFWEKRFGGTEEDEIQAMIQSSDGSLLMGGGSRSPAFPGMKKVSSQSIDIWAVKYDQVGDSIQWERTLGGAEFDNCYSLKENTVGNFILGGYSQSDLSLTKKSPNRGVAGTADFWINYLSPTGEQVWDQAFGGPEADVLEDVFQTSDGGYILAGHSRTDIGGDKTDGTNGLNDFWIVKTLCDVEVEFNDTIVCPNTDFVLDARDSNCVLCDWQWENNSKDSIRTLNLNVGQTFSVTLTDGVGCRWSDDVIVDVHAVEPFSLGPDQELCLGDSLQIGVATEAGKFYRWESGEPSSQIYVDSAGVYKLYVQDDNACIQEDSLELTVNPVPFVEIGNDTSLCLGDTIFLNAGPGHSQIDWGPNGSGQFLSISPNAPITIDVTVTNSFNCTASDQFQVTDVYELPNVSNLNTSCNSDNDAYVVSFEVNNFLSSELIVAGLLGNWNGNIFTSDTLSISDSYTFSVLNTNSCSSEVFNGTSPCVCLSDAGTIDQQALDLCEGENMFFTTSNVTLDINDNVEYILHDGDANNIGNTIFIYPTEEIYNPGFIPNDQTYFLIIKVGNADGNSINDSDACLDFSPGIPVTFNSEPTAVINNIAGQSLNCNVQEISLTGTSSFGNGPLKFNWTTSTGNIIGDPNLMEVEVNLEGWYILSLIDDNGCASLDSVFIDAEEGIPFVALSEPSILTCIDTVIMISGNGSSSGSEFSWEWTGDGIDQQTGEQVFITTPGDYSLIIENIDTGCDIETPFTVLQNIESPEISAGQYAMATCVSEEASLEAEIISQCDDCTIYWSSTQGSFTTGVNALDVEAQGIGTYYFSVTDNANGCVSIDSVELRENQNMPELAMLNPLGPACEWDLFGEMIVDEIIGGTFPYQYSLNGISFQSSNEFEDLTPGNYNLEVVDSKGCKLQQDFIIPAPVPVEVSLPDEFNIELGDSIQLIPFLSNTVISILWDGYGTESCPSCPNHTVTPLERTEYIIVVSNAAGCTVEDRVLVRVRDDVEPFVPNAFSPNNDGLNDFFYPFFNDKYVEKIESFSVFNRWGAMVWNERDIQPQEFIGWDGRHQGKQVNPDVFVYSIDVILINGDRRNFMGDFTLFR